MTKVCLEFLNGKKVNLNLYEEYAPITVANFMHLIDIKFFDGLIFHRLIKDFMFQGGAFYVEEGELKEKQLSYSIPGEFVLNNFSNPILHTLGTISMARTSDLNSGSSQFFICDADCSFLDGNYAAFGIVADQESFNIIHELGTIPTITLQNGMADFPSTNLADITIKSIYKLGE